MKFELRTIDNTFNLDIDADFVQFGDGISHRWSFILDGLRATLNKAPARVDIETGIIFRTAWLFNDEEAELLPKPYKQLPAHTSKTVHTHAEGQLVNKIKQFSEAR